MATGRLVRNFLRCHNKRPDGHTNYPYTTRSYTRVVEMLVLWFAALYAPFEIQLKHQEF